MNADRWEKIEMLCYEAERLEQPERDTYLNNTCGKDTELLADVKSLLDQSDRPWLQQPLVQVKSSLVFSREDALGDQTIGPYRIIRTIASGGMGRVYLAVRDDDQFERFVALKVIRKGLLSDEILNRFYEERQILASLNHPNIARLFDGGSTEDGTPWFAMEYIEGQPITDYCRLHNLSLDEKIELFLTVCSAVQYAHQNLVIHRDLKPANILVTPNGTPKLLDFGIAKLVDLEQKAGETQYQHRVMTPEYASPEQVRNESISTINDVYALGVLLYELLTDQLPYKFEKRTHAAIERTICNTIPKLPSAVSGDKTLKGDLDSVIMKTLRKDPSERYSSVEQFANDLERYEKALPILAQKHSLRYRAGKFLSRHKLGATVTSAVTLLILTFTIITFIQSKTIEERAIEAERQRDRAEQVSRFLTELFASADPSEAQNKSLTAVKLLHRGADRVETELSDQPRQQSDLYLVISDVYESLGLFDEGLDLAEKAYALQKELFDGNHPEIARSLNAMGWLYRQKGEYEKADSLITAGLSMRRQLYGSDHLDVARSLNDLAVLKQSRGDYAATDTLLQQAISIRKSVNGEQHESVAVALSNYAALKYIRGDLPAAETQMRAALKIFESTVDPNDMRTANVMTNLGAILTARKRVDEAVPHYREALQIRLQLLGEEHPDVASSYAHLGNLLRAQQKYKEAEPMLLKALELRTKLLGEEHVKVGDSRRVLGYLYEKVGDDTKAEQYYSGAVATFRQIFPDGHARTAQVLQMLGEFYLRTQSPAKAEQPLREALEMRKKIFGTRDIRTAESQLSLGLCLAELEQSRGARALLATGLQTLGHSEHNLQILKDKAEAVLSQL
jgi:serine/threonine-protein kinase